MTSRRADIVVRVPAGAKPKKFSGRSLTLRPGDNRVTVDRSLLFLLRRGMRRGMWELLDLATVEAQLKKVEAAAELPAVDAELPDVDEPAEESRPQTGRRGRNHR